MKIKIEPVKISEVQNLSDISINCFYDTFCQDNTEENMKLFLEKSFNTNVLEQEMRNSDNYFFFAKLENEIAGYIKLSNSKLPEAEETDSLKIERIYAVKDKIGHGVGKSLINFAFSFAREYEKQIVWLGVWEHNKRAIDFYHKYGFKKFGEEVFMLGNDAQTDWLMKLKL